MFVPIIYRENKNIAFYQHNNIKSYRYTECWGGYDNCPLCRIQNKILNEAMTEYYKRRLRDDYSK